MSVGTAVSADFQISIRAFSRTSNLAVWMLVVAAPRHTNHISMSSDFDPDTVGPPQHTSSPTAPKRTTKQKVDKRKLRVIIINFQSIKAKKESLWNLLSDIEPEILIQRRPGYMRELQRRRSSRTITSSWPGRTDLATHMEV